MQTTVDWDAIESPLELARALWKCDLRSLSPERFKELFDRVYGSTSELEALWQLGGASNDYLRCHPEAIDVPSKLQWTLAHSDDVEARIIGLKLLGRCRERTDEIVEEIVRVLRCDDDYERCGGLHEAGQLLEKVAAGKRVMASQSRESLESTLRSLLGHEESYTDETAQRLLDWLADLKQDNHPTG